MIRGLLFLALAVLVAVFSALFAFKNPGLIQLNLIAWEVEVQKSLAFVAALVIGWGFGVVTASLYLFRSMNEKRRLRKNIKMAEVELNNLRSLPMQDAG